MTEAIIRLSDGEIVAKDIQLPFRQAMPDGGMALFSKIGQAEPEHAPVFKVVPCEVKGTPPDYPHVMDGETSALSSAGASVSMTRTYRPDQSAYQHDIEARVDAVAAQRGYSSGVSLASYVTSTNPLWREEARAFVAWRDAVWAYALGELAKVQSSERQPPALSALMKEMPTIEWPGAE